MRQLWLIRHGQTAWAAEGRHTGRSDVPLTADGEAQASRLGPWLRERHPASFAAVFTSPLRRAAATCRLAGQGDHAIVDPDLMEWDYGAMDGRTKAEIRMDHPGWNLWVHGVTAGETLDDVAARVDRVIARATSAGGDVALFAHGHVLRVLAARFIGAPAALGAHLALETAGVAVLDDGPEGRQIAGWNLR